VLLVVLHFLPNKRLDFPMQLLMQRVQRLARTHQDLHQARLDVRRHHRKGVVRLGELGIARPVRTKLILIEVRKTDLHDAHPLV